MPLTVSCTLHALERRWNGHRSLSRLAVASRCRVSLSCLAVASRCRVSLSRTLEHCKPPETNKKEFGSFGGLELLLSAMRAHACDPCLQEWACIALTSLSYGSPHTATALFEFGALDLILADLARHRGPGVQQWACGALAQIVAGVPAARTTLLRKDREGSPVNIFEQLVAVLRNWAMDTNVTNHATLALIKLIKNDGK